MYKTSLLATGGFNEKCGILGVGTKQFTLSLEEFKDALHLLNYTEIERTEAEIKKFELKHNIKKNTFQKLLDSNLILESSLVKPKKDTLDFKNYLYLLSIDVDAKLVLNNLKNTTVIIIGCGGIGNFLSYSLATFTPEKMLLIDGDKIENSNLNRQLLFTTKDIGYSKADMLKKQIQLRNPLLDITSYDRYVTEDLLEKSIKLTDNKRYLVILSGDSITALEETTKYCVKNKIPFLNVGYLNDISVIGPFYVPGISSCPYCNNTLSLEKHEKDSMQDELLNINNKYEAPSGFTNNALASSLAMSDIIQFEAEKLDKVKSLNKRFGVDNVTFKNYTLDVPKDKNCSFCSEENK
ncbi:ThiF family adenylyltransferase [uncultured Ligilactobacillus sp.]|uniref:ThiF family adenylyltransferase n=1 Tax=uncultured Ligilactobacillus sp. TaxID=2837633 RepID=UPI00272D3C34|nr:ThiF family adenylyltransferase [uncultured Ligilactobacillus sp.]